ncbi:MAG: cytochrome c-type biogenesis protein CcmH [Solirubrobacterales bacterium]
MRRLALPFVAVALLVLAAPSLAASPQVGIADLEDEVMCPVCGTLLELANSPQAERQRAYVSKLIAAGKTKEEIKDALVAQYGREVLALPEGSGFSLSAYLVPVIAFLVAVAALAIGVMRWRRGGRQRKAGSATDPPRGADAERLEADLSRYDL